MFIFISNILLKNCFSVKQFLFFLVHWNQTESFSKLQLSCVPSCQCEFGWGLLCCDKVILLSLHSWGYLSSFAKEVMPLCYLFMSHALHTIQQLAARSVKLEGLLHTKEMNATAADSACYIYNSCACSYWICYTCHLEIVDKCIIQTLSAS